MRIASTVLRPSFFAAVGVPSFIRKSTAITPESRCLVSYLRIAIKDLLKIIFSRRRVCNTLPYWASIALKHLFYKWCWIKHEKRLYMVFHFVIINKAICRKNIIVMWRLFTETLKLWYQLPACWCDNWSPTKDRGLNPGHDFEYEVLSAIERYFSKSLCWR